MQHFNQLIHKKLLKKARLYQKYTQELYKILPTHFTGQCHVSDIDDISIKISVGNSLLANQLRYLKNDISTHFGRLLKKPITQVSIKITPIPANFEDDKSPNPSLTNQSAKSIKSLASNIEEGPLKQSLLKLSKNTK